jgi:hypothetical protein
MVIRRVTKDERQENERRATSRQSVGDEDNERSRRRRIKVRAGQSSAKIVWQCFLVSGSTCI